MTIQIDGAGMVNKGAELMLFAVLEQIKQYRPDVRVYYNNIGRVGILRKKFGLDIVKNQPYCYMSEVLNASWRVPVAMHRLGLPFPEPARWHAVRGIDMLLDAGGFQYSDAFGFDRQDVAHIRHYYETLNNNGCIIVLLPQAYGPFCSSESRAIAEILKENVHFLFVRDKVSFSYLVDAGVESSKLLLYPDFTALLQVPPLPAYDNLKGKVAIIPNVRMIDQTHQTKAGYIDFLVKAAQCVYQNGRTPFLLNHEGKDDLDLCRRINNLLPQKVEIITGVDCLTLKSIIAQCYAVISSRFHGVVSALSTGVPCLATGWSHKYEELFVDYGQHTNLLDIDNPDSSMRQITQLLNNDENAKSRRSLIQIIPDIKSKNKQMWEMIFCKLQAVKKE